MNGQCGNTGALNVRTTGSIGQQALAGLHTLAGTLGRWRSRTRYRAELARLAEEPRQLADVGLTREVVLREATKPFWRA